MPSLHDQIYQLFLREPLAATRYFALTIALREDGQPGYSCFSGWTGDTDSVPPREIREASIVRADRMLEIWKSGGEPGMVVNTISDFGIFFAFGGHAVVAEDVAQAIVPEWLEAVPVANVGERGFSSRSSLPTSALQRAPTKKARMRIIQRDDYRCRVCGRRPADYVDVELHVHHIRPWAMGGISEDSNLITLCHTCHSGLDPHFDFGLFKLLPSTPRKSKVERSESYQATLVAYQAAFAKHAPDSEA